MRKRHFLLPDRLTITPHRNRGALMYCCSKETDLLERLRAKDSEAVDEFVKTHLRWMLAVARTFLRDPTEAEDCVQEALLRALDKIDQFEQRAQLKAWLRRIVVNTALMSLRRSKRSRGFGCVFLDEAREVESGCPYEVPAPEPYADEILIRRNEVAELRMKIRELPERYQKVLVLRDIEERSTAETAEILGISPGAARVQLHRARTALRELLAPRLRVKEPAAEPIRLAG